MKSIVKIFNNAREVKNKISAGRKIFEITASLILGICLGVFSKYLDYRQAELPYILAKINDIFDLTNFFWRICTVDIGGGVYFCVQQQSVYVGGESVSFLFGHGGELLSVLQFCCGIFP